MRAVTGVEIGYTEFPDTCRCCGHETHHWSAVVLVRQQGPEEYADPLTVVCEGCVKRVMGAVEDAISAAVAVSRG